MKINESIMKNTFSAGVALTRTELKEVMGGVISNETWLKMCLEGKFGGTGVIGDGSAHDEIIQGICEALYEDMPS